MAAGDVPVEGDPRWDAAVDAVIGKFHVPEDYATKVVGTVLAAVREEGDEHGD